MSQFIILPHFYRQLKQLVKKYHHLKVAVINVLENFDKNKQTHLGQNVYKIKLRTSDVSRGKSKSFRLIVLVVESGVYLVPITIYFKGDRETVSQKELNAHLETILLELRSQNF